MGEGFPKANSPMSEFPWKKEGGRLKKRERDTEEEEKRKKKRS